MAVPLIAAVAAYIAMIPVAAAWVYRRVSEKNRRDFAVLYDPERFTEGEIRGFVAGARIFAWIMALLWPAGVPFIAIEYWEPRARARDLFLRLTDWMEK